MTIQTRVEARRGCGYRKAGGLYLVGEAFGDTCYRLPFPLHVCPTCGHGIRQSRAWTWIDGFEIFAFETLCGDTSPHCVACVICNPTLLLPTDEVKEGEERPNRGKSGLIWVGEKYYRFPETFIAEANRMQISRRINAVPHGFVLGETWIFLAHVKAIFERTGGQVTYTPGIFRAYRPTGIEYVVKGDETDEALEKMVKRGITPVKIVPEGITSDMDMSPTRLEASAGAFSKDDVVSGEASGVIGRVECVADPDLLLCDSALSRKSWKALKDRGFEEVKQIISMTRADLLKIKGIGKALAAEIAKQFGLKDK